MNLDLPAAQHILSQQPFSQLLGAELTRFGPEDIELQLPMRPELHNQHGFAHGGVLSYLADNALTYAGALALGTAIVTAEFKINFLRPGRGERLIARARVISGGKRQAVCQCDIVAVHDGVEKPCAVAMGTITTMAT